MAELITPSGCAHCGAPARHHWRRYSGSVGWHGYAPPTTDQIKARMLARRSLGEVLATTEEGV